MIIRRVSGGEREDDLRVRGVSVNVNEVAGVVVLGVISLAIVIILGIVVVRLSGRPGQPPGAQHD